MNYTMQEYANDIVYAMKEACDAAGVAHPNLVSESGRAVVAHHAVLVIEVIGTSVLETRAVPESLPLQASPVVENLFSTYREVGRKNLLEAYHDAVDLKDECLQLFSLGHLPLDQRVLAENIFWALCHKVLKLGKELDEMPEELEHLERDLSDTYFCNFSVFQSLPDSWAIDHLFPVMPIHRLNEEPTRRGVIADITCDSDGKIDHFIDRRDVKDVLELHPFKSGEQYELGIFLTGAYQEILGDLHNLFGDTNDITVRVAPGGYQIDHVEVGDTVMEGLKYVSYTKEALMARLRRLAESALRSGRITLEESRRILRFYEEGLSGYTYLERE
jgi:arginine decarboxylase